jgi:hypothetical protein
VNSPAPTPGRDLVGKPSTQAPVELLGDGPELGVADGAQPQLHPWNPVLVQRLCARQALVDHRPQALGVGGAWAPAAGDPRVARARMSTEAPQRGAPHGSRSGSGPAAPARSPASRRGLTRGRDAREPAAHYDDVGRVGRHGSSPSPLRS